MGQDAMPVVRETTFEEALAETSGLRRHLLLGNGFSRAFSDSFAYQSLYSVAPVFSPPVARLFETYKPDFEAVLRTIADQRLAGIEDLAELNRQEAEVKRAFAAAVARIHPESALSVSAEQSALCADFLRQFHDAKVPLVQRGKIFTTNYDLLLFWVIVAESKQLKCYDAFVREPGNVDFRPWDPDKIPDLVYLHGALHIYRHQGRLTMLRYKEGARLVDQIRERLARDEFPLLVAEGNSQMKSARIRSNPYLRDALTSFRAALNHPNNVLFTFGHSLGAVDAHLLQAIGSRKLGAVYIGAFGGLRSEDGERAVDWARNWGSQRAAAGRPGLRVAVYDSRICHVWR